MGLGRLSRAPVEEKRERFWALPGGYGVSTAGGYGGSSTEQALRNAATWACIDVLADGIARTPLDALRNRDGDRLKMSPAPALLARPSAMVLTGVWKTQLAASMLTDGNAFGRITAMSALAYPTQIELLDPASVTERKVVDGQLKVKVDQRVSGVWPFGDIWHVPGRFVRAGNPLGESPLEYAAKAINTSLAAEDFSYRFFVDGGHPSAVIYSDTNLDSGQAEDIKSAWRRMVSGRDPAVLGAGLKYERTQSDPGETQFIDLMRFEIEQVCRFWRVPPAMVYAAVSGQSVTYANVSDADLSYLKNSLDGYLVRVEEALSDVLPKPQYVRANRNAVLRSDATRRYAVYDVAVRLGVMSRNEVRALEDQPPIPGGDEFGPIAPAPPPTPAPPTPPATAP